MIPIPFIWNQYQNRNWKRNDFPIYNSSFHRLAEIIEIHSSSFLGINTALTKTVLKERHIDISAHTLFIYFPPTKPIVVSFNEREMRGGYQPRKAQFFALPPTEKNLPPLPAHLRTYLAKNRHKGHNERSIGEKRETPMTEDQCTNSFAFGFGHLCHFGPK